MNISFHRRNFKCYSSLRSWPWSKLSINTISVVWPKHLEEFMDNLDHGLTVTVLLLDYAELGMVLARYGERSWGVGFNSHAKFWNHGVPMSTQPVNVSRFYLRHLRSNIEFPRPPSTTGISRYTNMYYSIVVKSIISTLTYTVRYKL